MLSHRSQVGLSLTRITHSRCWVSHCTPRTETGPMIVLRRHGPWSSCCSCMATALASDQMRLTTRARQSIINLAALNSIIYTDDWQLQLHREFVTIPSSQLYNARKHWQKLGDKFDSSSHDRVLQDNALFVTLRGHQIRAQIPANSSKNVFKTGILAVSARSKDIRSRDGDKFVCSWDCDYYDISSCIGSFFCSLLF
jgi:hypothetical protein